VGLDQYQRIYRQPLSLSVANFGHVFNASGHSVGMGSGCHHASGSSNANEQQIGAFEKKSRQRSPS
jgi:hypothetical protein